VCKIVTQLQKATKLSDAARTNLFPSVTMIQELSMEFAVPALVEELESMNTKCVAIMIVWSQSKSRRMIIQCCHVSHNH